MKNAKRQFALEHLENREVFSVSLPQLAVFAENPGDAHVPSLNGQPAEGTARLVMQNVIEQEVNDSRATANQLPLTMDTGVRLRGELDGKDVDYFAFKGQENGLLQVKLQDTAGAKLQLTVEQADGTVVFSRTGEHKVGGQVKVTQGTQYFVRLSTVELQSTKYAGELTLTPAAPIREIAAHQPGGLDNGPSGAVQADVPIIITEMESNDTPGEANKIPLSWDQSVVIRGIAAGEKDADYFRLKASERSMLHLGMMGLTSTPILVQVEDAQGHVMYAATVSAQDRMVEGSVKLPEGEYFVHVSSADGNPGKYEINLNLDPPPKVRPLTPVGSSDDNRDEHRAAVSATVFAVESQPEREMADPRDTAFAYDSWR